MEDSQSQPCADASALAPKPSPAGERTLPEHDAFTVVFAGDVRKFAGNPFNADTPFGQPLTIGVGDAFKCNDDLTEVLEAALEFIEDEADNRAAAGSSMSDYEREPRELAARIEAALSDGSYATKTGNSGITPESRAQRMEEALREIIRRAESYREQQRPAAGVHFETIRNCAQAALADGGVK